MQVLCELIAGPLLPRVASLLEGLELQIRVLGPLLEEEVDGPRILVLGIELLDDIFAVIGIAVHLNNFDLLLPLVAGLLVRGTELVVLLAVVPVGVLLVDPNKDVGLPRLSEDLAQSRHFIFEAGLGRVCAAGGDNAGGQGQYNGSS